MLFGLPAATAPGETGPSLATHFDAATAAIAIQPNGLIVTAGSAGASLDEPSDFALARYRADGTLDPKFGAGGKALATFDLPVSGASALALQPDGKIVAAGRAGASGNGGSEVALARYRPNGTLDPRFGSRGKVVTAIDAGSSNARTTASAVALQGDGKIVVAGASTVDLGRFVVSLGFLARYLPDGTLDPGFGDAGIVKLGFPVQPGNNVAASGVSALAIQPDGKLVVAGYDYPPPDPPLVTNVALARLLPDGKLDPTFGADGEVLTAFGPDNGAGAAAMGIQRDGKIVVAGWCTRGTALARYEPNGDLDQSFGSGGMVVTDRGTAYGGDASALAVQPDGKIVVAGWIAPAIRTYFMLARYLPDGKLDPDFGGAGVTWGPAWPAEASAVAITADGKTVAAGRGPLKMFTSSGFGFALARYLPDAQVDTTFGKDGTLATDFTPVTTVASLTATQTKPGVRVVWRTLSEASTLGFNVYRQTRRGRLRVNASRVAAKGSIETGASYGYVDRRATRAARRYWVQEVKSDGTRRFYGPAVVRR
jgi:uncharacterized delta-60 repeat protein